MLWVNRIKIFILNKHARDENGIEKSPWQHVEEPLNKFNIFNIESKKDLMCCYFEMLLEVTQATFKLRVYIHF